MRANEGLAETVLSDDPRPGWQGLQQHLFDLGQFNCQSRDRVKLARFARGKVHPRRKVFAEQWVTELVSTWTGDWSPMDRLFVCLSIQVVVVCWGISSCQVQRRLLASSQDNPLLAVIDGDAIDQLSANDVRIYRRGNLSATSGGNV